MDQEYSLLNNSEETNYEPTSPIDFGRNSPRKGRVGRKIDSLLESVETYKTDLDHLPSCDLKDFVLDNAENLDEMFGFQINKNDLAKLVVTVSNSLRSVLRHKKEYGNDSDIEMLSSPNYRLAVEVKKAILTRNLDESTYNKILENYNINSVSIKGESSIANIELY